MSYDHTPIWATSKAAAPAPVLAPVPVPAIDRIRARLRLLGALGAADTHARRFGVTFDEMVSRSRLKHTAAARHHLWTLLRHSLALSYSDIGRIFGVDHTTAHAAVRKIEAELDAKHGRAA